MPILRIKNETLKIKNEDNSAIPHALQSHNFALSHNFACVSLWVIILSSLSHNFACVARQSHNSTLFHCGLLLCRPCPTISHCCIVGYYFVVLVPQFHVVSLWATIVSSLRTGGRAKPKHASPLGRYNNSPRC